MFYGGFQTVEIKINPNALRQIASFNPSCIYRPLTDNFPLAGEFFSSAALKSFYKPCEFENERLLPFVDVLYVDLKDSGYLAGVLLEYEAELVEQPLLLTQFAESPEQQIPLFRGINLSILRR